MGKRSKKSCSINLNRLAKIITAEKNINKVDDVKILLAGELFKKVSRL